MLRKVVTSISRVGWAIPPLAYRSQDFNRRNNSHVALWRFRRVKGSEQDVVHLYYSHLTYTMMQDRKDSADEAHTKGGDVSAIRGQQGCEEATALRSKSTRHQQALEMCNHVIIFHMC